MLLTIFPINAALFFLMHSNKSMLILMLLVTDLGIVVDLDLDFHDPLTQTQSTSKDTFYTAYKMPLKYVG